MDAGIPTNQQCGQRNESSPGKANGVKPTGTASNRIAGTLPLWCILIVATLVRIPYLGRASLWQDEIHFMLYAAPQIPVIKLLAESWNMILSIGQMPFSYLVWNVYLKIAEMVIADAAGNVFVLRLPAVCFGLLGIVFTFRFARLSLGYRASLITAVFYGFLFFPVYYSRELYCYSLILFLAPMALYHYRQIIFGPVARWRMLWAFLGLVGLVYTHLGSLMLLIGLGCVTFVLWLLALYQLQDKNLANRALSAGAALGCALIAFAPFMLRFAKHNIAHTTGSEHSIPVILNDVIGKMFLGERPGFVILAWVLFALGSGWLLSSHERAIEKRFWAAVTLVSMLLLAWATNRSQYLSVRYFTPVAPLVIMTYAVGWSVMADRIARNVKFARRDVLFWGGGSAVVLYTFFAYLMPLYAIKNKEPMDWKTAAEWLNENIEQGTPYMWYSGYLLRWVPGYYATPGLPAVSPFVHGPGAEQLAHLDARQQDFARRFPISVYLGATHNTSDIPAGDWPWPRDFYKQHIELGHPTLETLYRRGIWIGEPDARLNRNDWTIDVFYNTPADAITLARERDELVYLDFPGWRCEVIAGHPQGLWQEYAWVNENGAASIVMRNLTSVPVTGNLHVYMAVAGGAFGTESEVAFMQDETPIGGGTLMEHQFGDLVSGPIELDGDAEVHLMIRVRSSGLPATPAIIVHNHGFQAQENSAMEAQ